MTFLAAFIMKGRMQAMMVASSLAVLSLLFPPVSIVSSASVALVTLRRGGYEGLYVLIFSCLSAAVLGFFLFGSLQFALLYGLVLWLPIWLISIVLREGKHLSVAIQIAVLLGMAGVVGFYLYVDDPAVMWQSLLNLMAQPMLANNPDVPLEDVKQSILFFSQYMTGGVAAGSVYGLLFGLFLARWWQSVLYNPGGFRAEYLTLRVHPKLALASLLIVAIAWLTSGAVSEVCWNLSILSAVLYTFVGTSILHSAFSESKIKRFAIPFLYITLVLVPHVIAVVIIVGVIDAWLDLRSKILNKKNT